MIIEVIRHGKAERDAPSGRDADRPLRARGERQARGLGDLLTAQERRPARLLASPFVRARETARLIAERVGIEVEFASALEVGNPLEAAVRLIEEHAGASPLALVGHNNQLEDLVNFLLPPSDDFGHLRTGEAAILEIDSVTLADPGGAARLLERLRLEDMSEG